ncbi:hypothetical protein FGG08_006589 [Glutinoglossum americanum]|uniref:Peptidase M20 dimerisation domain-containing protein n=1 Tax=Glutinoglossum americanum TaxID=1670608 RepID=A0A9P8I351_9PEZI|nr:hypothetical protein FGG08_006589 [Glutinoglossum americanum]
MAGGTTAAPALPLRGRSADPEAGIRARIQESIDRHKNEVMGLNEKVLPADAIWSNPELAWHETTAHDAICGFFDSLGADYKVTRKAYGIDTSFQVEAGTGADTSGKKTRTIVFNAEYDALPNMVPIKGTDPPKYKAAHACGHNLIASASIAAFIACWETLKAAKGTGTIKLLGTPAEESGGGKLRLLAAGAYNAIAACLMVHPGPMYSDKSLAAVSVTSSLASQRIIVDFEGQASHAGLAPWKGKNALDALVISYVSISALRQQLNPSVRVCGIITQGGKAANVIPDHTSAEFSIRAKSRKDLDDLREKIARCFKSGAEGAGCIAKVNETHRAYWDLNVNRVLCDRFTKHMKGFGVNIANTLAEITDDPGAATDQGNVSHYCPAIQPIFAIESGDAVNHNPAFADAAHTPDAFARAIACSKGMAAVGYEVLTSDATAKEVADEFSKSVPQKATALARQFGREPPTQEQIDNLLASPPSPLRKLLDPVDITKEQALGALMAADVFIDGLKGLL